MKWLLRKKKTYLIVYKIMLGGWCVLEFINLPSQKETFIGV